MDIILSRIPKNKILLSFGLIIYITGCIVLILSDRSNGGIGLQIRQTTVVFTIIYIVASSMILHNFFVDILLKIPKRNPAELTILDAGQSKYYRILHDDETIMNHLHPQAVMNTHDGLITDKKQLYSKEQCNLYMKVLEHTMSTTKIYLQPGLSLHELSTITNIPRHHFSNLLNVHLGKSFYQFISEYRIQEAIFRIENDDNITMESLSYECGFNSKSSFNRYFKSATEITPSEYRKGKMISG